MPGVHSLTSALVRLHESRAHSATQLWTPKPRRLGCTFHLLWLNGLSTQPPSCGKTHTTGGAHFGHVLLEPTPPLLLNCTNDALRDLLHHLVVWVGFANNFALLLKAC